MMYSSGRAILARSACVISVCGSVAVKKSIDRKGNTYDKELAVTWRENPLPRIVYSFLVGLGHPDTF